MSNFETSVPIRHPRPLTAAELYLELEKEQEAVVNRLTRELSTLRAQHSASVASNASHSSTSTSASFLPVDPSDPNPTHQITGPTHPTPSRRHRSSSSVSTRSINTPSTSVSSVGGTTGLSTVGGTASVPIGGISQASADRTAAAAGGGVGPSTRSRQSSVTASGTSTPARMPLDAGYPHGYHQPVPAHGYTLPHRPSMSQATSATSNTTWSTHAHAGSAAGVQPLPSPAASPSLAHALHNYAETATNRTELDIVKAENEALRQRIRQLERTLQTRRESSQSDTGIVPQALGRERSESRMSSAGWQGGGVAIAGPRERSESQSTTASEARSRRGGVEDESVRVGESAGSAWGVGR
ncbi:hypothetical protein LTR50_000204 [Elasticomyces elasticus]|nr:hypothetical protein LTR50_000204 [Elasticomyces elasticus]